MYQYPSEVAVDMGIVCDVGKVNENEVAFENRILYYLDLQTHGHVQLSRRALFAVLNPSLARVL